MDRSVVARAVSDRILYARLLVEMGELDRAERQIAEILERDPRNVSACSLFAKIKHTRGELSQAIASWAQIHAQSPNAGRASMCLGSILQLATDPARAAGDFLALAQQATFRPTVHLELEIAFRLFLARRTDDARQSCARLALKYEARDRELHKLAVLADAWIAELSGDYVTARQVLERLGTARGFENDIDRLLALARIYDRLGSPPLLERAARIFRHLAQTYGKLSALGSLATLHRRLGDLALAGEWDTEYTHAFRNRMHRVSRADAARVAAVHHIPLERLRELHLTEAPSERKPSRRERAIEAFLRADPVTTKKLLLPDGALLEQKYLAELALLEGEESALPSLLALLALDPDDLRLATMLLDRHATNPDPRVAEAFAATAVGHRVTQALEAELLASPLSAATWRHTSTLLEILGDRGQAKRHAERASALETAARRDKETVGRVLAAAVFHFVGKAKGVIHQIWVDRTAASGGQGGALSADDILGNLTFEMKQNVRNAFYAVREYARSRFPQQTSDIFDYQYTYKITKEDEPSGGASAGVPTALAFLSVFLQRPIPQDMAFSGTLIADSHDALVVRRVGEVEYKVKAAYHRSLRMLVLPAENRADLVASAQVPAAVSEEIVRFVRSFDEVLVLAWGDKVWTA